MKNQITIVQILKILISDFKNSKVPKNRLFFLNSVKELIKSGEKLNKLNPNTETQITIKELKEQIKDYTLYPKLNNNHS